MPGISNNRGALTRIIHEASTAAAQTGMSTALRFLGLLGALLKHACGVFGRAPCIHAVCTASLQTFMNNPVFSQPSIWREISDMESCMKIYSLDLG
jgi:hypothetical protein